MNKKGIELGMNTIVISIIVIIVLVILVYLITTQFSIFKKGITCNSVAGKCQESCENPITAEKSDGTIIPSADLCSAPGEVCCSVV